MKNLEGGPLPQTAELDRSLVNGRAGQSTVFQASPKLGAPAAPPPLRPKADSGTLSPAAIQKTPSVNATHHDASAEKSGLDRFDVSSLDRPHTQSDQAVQSAPPTQFAPSPSAHRAGPDTQLEVSRREFLRWGAAAAATIGAAILMERPNKALAAAANAISEADTESTRHKLTKQKEKRIRKHMLDTLYPEGIYPAGAKEQHYRVQFEKLTNPDKTTEERLVLMWHNPNKHDKKHVKHRIDGMKIKGKDYHYGYEPSKALQTELPELGIIDYDTVFHDTKGREGLSNPDVLHNAWFTVIAAQQGLPTDAQNLDASLTKVKQQLKANDYKAQIYLPKNKFPVVGVVTPSLVADNLVTVDFRETQYYTFRELNDTHDLNIDQIPNDLWLHLSSTDEDSTIFTNAKNGLTYITTEDPKLAYLNPDGHIAGSESPYDGGAFIWAIAEVAAHLNAAFQDEPGNGKQLIAKIEDNPPQVPRIIDQTPFISETNGKITGLTIALP